MYSFPSEFITQHNQELNPGTIAYALYLKILANIRSGRIEPGKQLKSRDLMNIYQSSTGPCREALARLASEGFVVAEGKKGFRVRLLSRKDFIQIADLRGYLEAKAFRESIEARTDSWEDRMLVAFHRLCKYQKPRQMPNGIDSREDWHRNFHFELLSCCGSPWLLKYYSQLSSHVERYFQIFALNTLGNPSHIEKSDVEHKQLMELAMNGEAEAAVKFLTDHRFRSTNEILSNL